MVSAVYGFFLFVSVEFQLNFYRILRVFKWDQENAMWMNVVGQSVLLVILAFMISFLSGRFLEGRLARFWSAILWIPYFFFYVFLFESLFPLTNPMDDPLPWQGFLVLSQQLVFPFYIVFFYIIGNAWVSGRRRSSYD